MKFWYRRQPSWQAWLLWPLAGIFGQVARWRLRQRRASSYGVPVLIVGNLSVGGTGKTPAIIAIVDYLQKQGFRCGVVSRGYGGKATAYPYRVTSNSAATLCGDEPLLLFRQLQCPVLVDPNRDRAVRTLVESQPLDIVISDDGLQHYAMGRSLELVMVDGRRGLGNGCLLPAGPLREPVERLELVDWVVAKHQSPSDIKVSGILSLNPQRPVNAAEQPLPEQSQIVVCAGIGDPESVVLDLEAWGYQVVQLVEPGDHRPVPEALLRDVSRPLVITEKDAVKLASPLPSHCYVMHLRPNLPVELLADIAERIRRLPQ